MQQLIAFDEQLAASFSGWIATTSWVSKISIFLGVGLVYILPLLLLFTWFAISRKAALRAAITGALAWQGLNKVIAAIVDRPRPSMSELGVKELVFHRPDTSFPSDHSAFLMAVTVSFYLSGQRKLGHICLAIAILVGISRVGIGVHFPADILAGWLVGTTVAFLLNLIQQPLDQVVIEPLIRLARKFRL